MSRRVRWIRVIGKEGRLIYSVHVELEDGQVFDTKIDGRDIRMWEVETRKSFLSEDFSYSALTDLARLALKRTGELEMAKANFDNACVLVKETSNAEADPTPSDRTDAP